MSFKNKIIVVAGATGVVGSGAVRKFLDAGATVVGISRSADKISRLRDTLKIQEPEPFFSVVGDFKSEADAEKTGKDVSMALGGKPIDHVVSVLGFVSMGNGATATPLADFKQSLDDGLYNNFLAAKTFLPGLKSREGSSFTLVSGGFAHFPSPMPGLWMGTAKNAALHGLTYGLAGETANDAVRVNCACIHVGVAPIGGDKNQLGMDSEGDSLAMGVVFPSIAASQRKGEVICLTDWSVVEKIGAA